MNKMEWLRGFTLVIGVTAILTGALGAQETKAGDSQAMTVATPAAPAAATPAPTEDLTQVSLESLMGLNVVVTSSAKKAESLMNATSAIFVITQEDIQQSGARSIPDLLTMVPGVQVARQNNNQWAISARGFDDQYNDKMLVLVDGRSVYQPITGGVNWNQLDIPLEEIDRIEVIRGPGGRCGVPTPSTASSTLSPRTPKHPKGFFFQPRKGCRFIPLERPWHKPRVFPWIASKRPAMEAVWATAFFIKSTPKPPIPNPPRNSMRTATAACGTTDGTTAGPVSGWITMGRKAMT